MAKDFKTISNFRGYITKPDETNTSIRNLVSGSQNVLVNDAEKVEVRGGYSLYGASNSASNGIESDYVWKNSTGTELPIRSYDDELEVYLGTVDGVAVNAWTKVADSWSDVDFDFTTWWDETAVIDNLLFVNGDSNIYEWTGGVTTISATTSNTIKKNGSATWTGARFDASGKVLINGTEYTYTGGAGTTTLTGVTPDPTGEADDSVVTMTVTTNSNQPAANLTNTSIETLNNQVWVGSNKSRKVWISKNTSFTDYTKSSPRLAGEGETVILDGTLTGLATLDKDMILFSDNDGAFKSEFKTLDIGGTLSETLGVRKLVTGVNQGLKERDLLTNVGKSIAYVTNEPALRIVSRSFDIETVNVDLISDPIKPDFEAGDFSNGKVHFDKNNIYITLPNDGRVFIYELDRGFWQPPQILPFRRMSTISGDLYGHSNTNPETFKMFDGLNDNDAPISYIAKFAYRNFGTRENLKVFDEYFNELYLSSNTKITLSLDYDYKGSSGQQEFELDGSNSTYTFGSTDDNSLGKKGIGQSGLGSSTAELNALPKYRKINTMTQTDFYELQVTYSTTEKDANFEILSHGPNARLAKTDNFAIKE